MKFVKSLSRETSLFMEGLWSKGLSRRINEKFGWKKPDSPVTALFVNDGLIEIWENNDEISTLLDNILAENKKGPGFLENIFAEYQEYLAEINKFHAKKILTDPKNFARFAELIYEAAADQSVFFYTGIDQRSPEEAKDISVQARKIADFFVENNLFIKRNIADYCDISEEMAQVVLPEEITSLPTEEILEKRLEKFLLIDGEQPYLGSLESFNRDHPNLTFAKEVIPDATDEIKGQIAYQGKVKGKVKIVKKQSQISKVIKGDVLVSPMTTPDLLSAMKLAAAFVTDEGGITCHAAIVAREMKKPCIIGTKIATEVFKDGDIVEVDADGGLVKLLKRNDK